MCLDSSVQRNCKELSKTSDQWICHCAWLINDTNSPHSFDSCRSLITNHGHLSGRTSIQTTREKHNRNTNSNRKLPGVNVLHTSTCAITPVSHFYSSIFIRKSPVSMLELWCRVSSEFGITRSTLNANTNVTELFIVPVTPHTWIRFDMIWCKRTPQICWGHNRGIFRCCRHTGGQRRCMGEGPEEMPKDSSDRYKKTHFNWPHHLICWAWPEFSIVLCPLTQCQMFPVHSAFVSRFAWFRGLNLSECLAQLMSSAPAMISLMCIARSIETK